MIISHYKNMTVKNDTYSLFYSKPKIIESQLLSHIHNYVTRPIFFTKKNNFLINLKKK